MNEDRHNHTVVADPKKWRLMKSIALMDDKDFQDVIDEAFSMYIKKKGLQNR